MDFERIQDDEYELQYYEFSSRNFVTEFKDLVLGTIKASINDLEKTLFSTLPQDVCQMSSKQFNDLFEEYSIMIHGMLKIIEDDIRNFFTIPKHILLPEDESNVPCPKEEIEVLYREIKELEELYMKERAFNYLCKKEFKIVDDLIVLNKNIENFVGKLKPNRTAEINDTDSGQGLVKIHQELSNKLYLLNTKSKFICK